MRNGQGNEKRRIKVGIPRSNMDLGIPFIVIEQHKICSRKMTSLNKIKHRFGVVMKKEFQVGHDTLQPFCDSQKFP